MFDSPSATEANAWCDAQELLPLLYSELRRLAAAKLAGETVGQTLQPTALVHEAYLRLVRAGDSARWENRAHFFSAAAEAMRRILIEAARRKHGEKHGGKYIRRELALDGPAGWDRTEELLELNDAVDVLARENPRAADVVKLRYFAGLTVGDTAAALGVSPRTVHDDWAYARAWLMAALEEQERLSENRPEIPELSA